MWTVVLKCLTKCLTQENDEQKTKGVNITFVMKERTSSSRRWVDFLKSPSSCLFSTRRTKDFSYLIAANFSDLKTGRCASTNQVPWISLGDWIVKPWATKHDLRLNSIWGRLRKLQRLRDIMYFCLRNFGTYVYQKWTFATGYLLYGDQFRDSN